MQAPPVAICCGFGVSKERRGGLSLLILGHDASAFIDAHKHISAAHRLDARFASLDLQSKRFI